MIRKLSVAYLKKGKYIRSLIRELGFAEAVSLKSPKLDGMPKSGAIFGLDDQIARIDGLKRRIEQERKELLALEDEIDSLIDRLHDDEMKMVMRDKYLNGKTWPQVAVDLFMSESKARRIAVAAMEEINKWDL